MSAVRASMFEAWTALASFLRGFVGSMSVTHHCDHNHDPGTMTPASVRHALEAQASRRGRCC